MKKGLYLVLICIALGLGYLKFQAARSPQPTVVSSPSPSPTPTPQTENTLETPYFTLTYPLEATVSSYTSPDSSTWAISYLGKSQRESGRTQTELFDGYNLSLTHFEVVGDNVRRTQAEADRTGIVDSCGQENVTVIRTSAFSNYEALTFYGGCLGEADYYYLQTESGLYRVTKMIVGPDEYIPEYEKSIDLILSKLMLK